MNEAIIKLVNAVGHFHHFAKLDTVDSIKEFGLDPKFSRQRNRLSEEPPVLRFCTPAYRRDYRNMFRASHQSYDTWFIPDVVEVRVAATSLTSRGFGLDMSHGGQGGISVPWDDYNSWDRDRWEHCISSVGSLSCYDAIAPDEVEILARDDGTFEPLLSCQEPFIIKGCLSAG